jgi:alkylation response protein AidB-like acyl-CoA dehydrogenase
MTEASGGSDLQAIKTFAKKDGDDWILNGSKTFIRKVLITVFCKTDF